MELQLNFKKYFFLLKFYFYKKDTCKLYDRLLISQYYSKDKIIDYSFRDLLKILEFAYNNSSFYKKKYDDAGIDLSLIRTKDDINKIPILTKQEIKDNLFDLLIDSPKKKYLSLEATGGSTGVPTNYFQDKRIPVEAFAWRYLNWWGLNPWDDGAYLWRMPERSNLKILLNKLSWWPTKKIRLDATFLDDKKFKYFANTLNKYKPKLIQGYIGAVYEFALYLKNNNLTIFSPKAIWVTSAPVANYQRILIEEIFKAPLYNEYGSSEIPWIAAQCQDKTHLHVNAEGRYLEIINRDKNGIGDIIITDLLNFSFPLIRYELGDRTSLIDKKCSCGNNLPLINAVKGRTSDVIIIPNTGKIDGSFLTTIFDTYPESILAFQLIQHRNYNLTLKIVPNYKYQNWEKEVKIVNRNLLKLIGNKLEVEIEYCDKILSDRGKTRFIISKI